MMSSNVWAPGKNRPCFARNSRTSGSRAADPFADQLVEVADHVAVGGEVLRRHRPDGIAHPRYELVEDLLAQPLDELVEALPGVGLEEVVLAQIADALAEIGRERVEPIEPA